MVNQLDHWSTWMDIHLDGYTHLDGSTADGSTANGESSVDSANPSEVLQTHWILWGHHVDFGRSSSAAAYWLCWNGFFARTHKLCKWQISTLIRTFLENTLLHLITHVVIDHEHKSPPYLFLRRSEVFAQFLISTSLKPTPPHHGLTRHSRQHCSKGFKSAHIWSPTTINNPRGVKPCSHPWLYCLRQLPYFHLLWLWASLGRSGCIHWVSILLHWIWILWRVPNSGFSSYPHHKLANPGPSDCVEGFLGSAVLLTTSEFKDVQSNIKWSFDPTNEVSWRTQSFRPNPHTCPANPIVSS